MTEKTLSIVKPDAVRKQCIGNIIARLEAGGLRVVAAKMLTLSREQAAEFYGEHRGRPFFEGLLDFMTSGPILAQVLEGDNAVAKNREMMGATDPANAAPGTLRRRLRRQCGGQRGARLRLARHRPARSGVFLSRHRRRRLNFCRRRTTC